MKKKENPFLRKRTGTVFLASLMLWGAMSVQTALANVQVNGLIEPVKYVVVSGTSFVGLHDIGTLLGAEVLWSSPNRTVTLRKGSDRAVVYVDTNMLDMNGKRTTISPGCRNIEGSVYVPLRVIAEVFGAEVEWDSQTKDIRIGTGETLLSARAEPTENAVVLTLEEAYEQAVKNDTALKNLSDSETLLLDTEEELYESMESIYNADAYDDMFDNPNDAQASAMQIRQYENIVQTINVTRGILSTQKGQENLVLNEQIAKDALQLSLLSYLMQLDILDMNLTQTEEAIALAKENIENMELKYSLGYESEINVTTEKNNLKSLELSYEQLKLNYADAKLSLNDLLGLPQDSDVIIEDQMQMTEAADFNLEDYIFRSVSSDPSIKVRKNALDVAEYNLRTNVVYADESEIELQNKVNSAKRAYDDAKKNLEAAIRKNYNEINRMQQKQESYGVALEKAKDTYNTAATNYLIGNITLLETKQAKMGVLEAEIDAKTNELSYDLLLFRFERPYLLSQQGTSAQSEEGE